MHARGDDAAARGRRTRGETQSFSPLANHPISYGWEQAHRYVPKELWHLLPQIRARCARKVRNAKASAAHFPQETRRGGLHPSLRRARRPRRVISGVAPVLLTLWGSRAAGGKRDLPLRAQRALKEGVVIRKRQGEPCGSPSSCVPAAHSRECAGMNWHTRRAEVVNRASLARRGRRALRDGPALLITCGS